MNEINTPEQRIDKPSVEKTPEQLRIAEAEKAQIHDRLDNAGTREPLKNKSPHGEKIRESAESNEKQRESKLDGSTTDKKEQLSEAETQKVQKIVEPHYGKARAITENATVKGAENGEKDHMGANFTDHNEKHVEQVKTKTTETLDSSIKAINAGKMERTDATGDVKFNSNVDYKVTQAAALSHDTGMSDDLYHYDKSGNVEKQNPKDFKSVRDNHSSNSALNVLINRDKYKKTGFTDAQVDEIAALCSAHSKSGSGIRDLNSSESWKAGFDKMDAFVDKYNKDHPDKKISFDRSRFENDKEKLGSMATEALALRVGDVSRDSGPDAPSQSGEIVHVEKSTVKSGEDYKQEIKDAVVMRGDTPITDEKGKQVHIGEQNISENHTEFKDGKLTHTITVNDGNYAPGCTAEAIKDHIGELKSANNLQATVDIKLDNWNEDTKKAYLQAFRDYDFKNVDIKFPWTEGEKK